MLTVGLTGSIGMGKSTTAAMIAAADVPVFDADAVVHALYAAGGPAGPRLVSLVPTAVDREGAVNRARLSAAILQDSFLLKAVERIVHPLVSEERRYFLSQAKRRAEPVVVLDIPLLFETRQDHLVREILVVSAAPEIQRARVLARPGMSPEKLAHILYLQVPDAVKRAYADHIIRTDFGIAQAQDRVAQLITHWRCKARYFRGHSI
jgi:dephospho-CoA kinase